MLVWKKLDISDKSIFNSYFSLYPQELSEFSFTGLILRQYSCEITYTVINNCLCIRFKYDNLPYQIFYPIGRCGQCSAVKIVIQWFLDNKMPFQLRSMSAVQKEITEKCFPGKFSYTSNRDKNDYVYLISDLIELKGKRYHSKKNHINHFLKHNSYTYAYLSDKLISEVRKFINKWYKQHDFEKNIFLLNEKKGIDNYLKVYNLLDAKAICILVENKVIAFTIGALLNDNTVVIHIEKADASYHGAYQLINQMFLMNEWKNELYVNREDDDGIEGLRKVKLSYHPVKYVEKYNGVPIIN